MALAVMARIGKAANRGFSRMRRVAVKPSITGIWQSMSTPSNGNAVAPSEVARPREVAASCDMAASCDVAASRAARASRPLLATTTSIPAWASSSRASSWFTSLSSTKRMRAPATLAIASERVSNRAGWPAASITRPLPRASQPASSRLFAVMGLVRAMRSFTPSCSAWLSTSSRPKPVIMRGAGGLARSRAAIWLRVSRPSMTGIFQSSRIRS